MIDDFSDDLALDQQYLHPTTTVEHMSDEESVSSRTASDAGVAEIISKTKIIEIG